MYLSSTIFNHRKIEKGTREFHEFKLICFSTYALTQLAFGALNPIFGTGLAAYHLICLLYKDHRYTKLILERGNLLMTLTERQLEAVRKYNSSPAATALISLAVEYETFEQFTTRLDGQINNIISFSR
jgi:hypothetical protein